MSTSIASTLMEIITTAQNELGKMGHATGSTPGKKGKGAKPVKKVSSRKGRSTANSDFTKKIYSEHKPEMDAFIAARVAKAAAGELLYTADQPSVKSGTHSVGDAYTEKEAAKGAQMIFASFYKSQHNDEWTAFQAAWNVAHPKESASAAESESESVASGANDAASVAASDKPKRTMSDEQKAKMKAGREASAAKKKAAKEAEEQGMKDAIPMAEPDLPAPVVAMAAPAPVMAMATPVPEPAPAKKAPKQAKKATPEPAPVAPAPVAAEPEAVEETEEDGNEHLPFKYGGANYLRIGTRRADGNHIWLTGDLWASNKGLRGKYIGCLADDGKSIDRTATEPELE